ncbi:MAG TPA: monofunctional biosynthetic peptidoglycan transglycosylase [Bacteroidia bacterium]|nr:monofunctional biosynthetic peptidoglycan transglycosylase [Bacteroidia bacterium]
MLKILVLFLWKWIKRLALFFIISTVVAVILYKWIPIPYTPLMIIRCFEQKAAGKPIKLEKDWVPLSQISARLPEAVIASEDQKFEEHFGFDIEAIEKAQQYNARMKGKRVRGASTITQQTAKNVFLTQSRTYWRKALEVYFSFLIEVCWSKERIMEVYLNVIEMGDGIYGAEAAAQAYFNKIALKLTAKEASLIAACLPNPRIYIANKPSRYIERKSVWIMRAMRRLDYKNF